MGRKKWRGRRAFGLEPDGSPAEADGNGSDSDERLTRDAEAASDDQPAERSDGLSLRFTLERK